MKYMKRCAQTLKRAAVILTCTATSVAGMAIPTAAAEETTPGATQDNVVEINEGTVTWSVRDSWRDYVADGAVPHDGTKINEKGDYVWPIKSGTYNTETKALHLKLGGYIHNLAYCNPPDSFENCTLDVIFKELEVDITQDEQRVTGIYAGNTRDNIGSAKEYDRATWATFRPKNATVTVEGGETTIADMPGFIEDIPLYGKGGVASNMTINYKGPGGFPEFNRALGTPGSWNQVYEETGTVIPGMPKEDLERYYDTPLYPVKVNGEDTDVLLVLRGKKTEDGSYHRFLDAINTSTKKLLKTVELPGATCNDNYEAVFVDYLDACGFRAVFDKENTLYFSTQGTTKEESDTKWTATKLSRVSWKNDDFSIEEEIWDIPAAQAMNLGWDHRQEKVFVTASVPQKDTFTTIFLLDPSSFGNGSDKVDVEEVSTGPIPVNLPNYDGPYDRPFPTSPEPPAVLKDGTYIYPSGSNSFRSAYKDTDGKRVPLPPVFVSVAGAGEFGAPGFYLTGAFTSDDPFLNDYRDGWRQILPAGDGKFFAVGTEARELFGLYELTDIDLLGLPAKDAKKLWDKNPEYDLDKSYAGASYNEELGYGIYFGKHLHSVVLFTEDGIQHHHNSSHIRTPGGRTGNTAIRGNGELIFSGINKDNDLTIYTGYAYRYGDFATQPTDQTVDLGDKESASVTFTAAVTEDTKDPKYQWQVKLKGDEDFTDVKGATEPTYTFDATAADADNTYRLLVETGAGWTASNEAALTVNWTPKATTPALPAKVNDGDTATFTATFTTPEGSTLGWKRYDKSTGLWQPITADGSVFTIVTEGNTTTLTIKGVNTDMSGMKVQAYATSPAGVTATSDSALTVTQPQEIPDEGVDITGVRFLWDVGGEIQNQPPAGGSNYLSAGVSDGTKDTYKNTEGNVKILTGNPGDTMTQPTYDTRADFLGNDSKQFVEITGGKGHINKDKSGTISWKGVFSVNFYGGLVPFTITNPKLTIDTDGTGTLVGDLSGYSSDMANPTEKTALDPQPNTVIARFTNASLQTDGSITLTPLYSGVKVNTEGAERKQNTEAQGWGSWPQEFVDFQIKTGLSSYFYTSSASEKPAKKAPLPVTVDFDKAETSAPGEGDTETDDTPTEGKDNDKQTTPAPNPGTGTTDNGTGTGTADNGKVTVIINNQQPDGSNTLGAMLQATTALGSIIALIVSLQTAWMIIASMPGGIPAQLAKLFPPAPWQQPAPAPAAAPAPVAAPDNTKTIPVAVPA